MEKIFHFGRKYIPSPIFNFFQPVYHYLIAILGTLIYRFPSRNIRVIGVTGTKGKSTTTEIINAILEKAGYKTALSNTIRYKIGNESFPNMFKMSMPGRFFVPRLMRKAIEAKCDFVILEMTSQGVLQYRHKFIELDSLVFTNLSPEHIESHGSYEKYRDAKLELARLITKSHKRPRVIVVNGDDIESEKFLKEEAEIKRVFDIKNIIVNSPLPGEFNLYNVQAAVTLTEALGISNEIIKEAVENFKEVKGRVEEINVGQKFKVIVDYAHTADSMEKLYKTFERSRKICIFGATGGGRDKWKRKEMGKIADLYCDEIILTDDDSYDENPEEITKEIALGIKNKIPKIMVDRREAIRAGIRRAQENDVVLITGKGTDPFLMGPNGKKIPWSDAEVTTEELKNYLGSTE
jgi:UDP-N-acetylmuramoyl-L-alanyl-D-glutamate--2,6-diaminopimelate ligase